MLLRTSYDDVLTELEHDLLTSCCQPSRKLPPHLTLRLITPASGRQRLLNKRNLSSSISSLLFQTGLILVIVFLFACLRKRDQPSLKQHSLPVQTVFTYHSILTLLVTWCDKKNSYNDSHFKRKKIKSSNLSAGPKARGSASKPSVLLSF